MGLPIGSALAWATVVLLALVPVGASGPDHPLAAALLFIWLCGVVLLSALDAVRVASALASTLREPFGTLILTLCVSVIEVVLIGAAMSVDPQDVTMARDTMFSVLMIVLNGVVGFGLLVGGLRHHEQHFNLQGTSAYLSLMIPLATIVLVLPSFTESTRDGELTLTQAICFSVMTLLLYVLFLWFQTGRHRGYFAAPPLPDAQPRVEVVAEPPGACGVRPLPGSLRLLACIAPISLLAMPLASLLDRGLDGLGIPTIFGGIVIALLVFAPEGLSSLIAFRGNQLTKAFNVSMGAATSTLGLTVPVVLFISLYTGQRVVLGLPPASIALLAATFLLSILTFSARTTMLAGAVHLSLFVAFLMLALES